LLAEAADRGMVGGCHIDRQADETGEGLAIIERILDGGVRRACP